MINKAYYFEHIKGIRDSTESITRIVRDIETINDFEKKTGKLIGIINNQPFYNINLDLYYDANGLPFRYCNIEYNKMGAAILPILKCEKSKYVLLQYHYRQFVDKTTLEIPRGFADPNDITSKITALRELSEETGIIMENINIIELGTVFPDTGLSNAEISLFAAEIDISILPKIQNRDGNEDIRGYRLFSISTLQSMIAENKISDSFTLAALFRYIIIHL